MEINMNSCNHISLEKPVIVRHDLDKCETAKESDYLINGKKAILNSLSTKLIKSINARNPSKDKPKDNGTIEITVDKIVADSFNISVAELINKRIHLKDTMVLYMIDDKFPNKDISNYYLNEKSVSSIEVYSSKNFSGLNGLKQEFKIVNILIRSKRNEEITLR